MKTSEGLNEIFTALSKAQGEFGIALKDAANPFFKSKYAKFENVVEACRPALAKNGLSFVQVPTVNSEGKVMLITRVCHASGQWIESEYPIKPMKDDPQALGSATTYACRYSLKAVLGIVESDHDDDGEGAAGRGADGNGKGKSAELAPKADAVELLKKFEGIGVSSKSVLSYCSRASAEHLTIEDLVALNEIGFNIKNGNLKKQEIFGTAVSK